jgi:putative oxidoreductase
MNTIKSATTVLARFLLTAFFLSAGMHKIFNWHASEQFMMDAFSLWQSHLSFSEAAQEIFSSLVLFTPLILFIVGAIEISGGLLILLGVREKLGAALLLIMMIPTTILFHQFWFLDGQYRDVQQIMFLKNLGTMGGLLLVILYGVQTPQKKENGFKF